MIRPILAETKRYGEYSKPGEFVYDHPFQWGSRRIGPDLARVGGKYNEYWHVRHLMDPSSVTEGTIMPRYTWLLGEKIDFESIPVRIKAMQALGVPYTQEDRATSVDHARHQAADIVSRIASQGQGLKIEPESKAVALIAYLQRLGTDLHAAPTTPDAPALVTPTATPTTSPATTQPVIPLPTASIHELSQNTTQGVR